MLDNKFTQLVSECQTVLAILGHPAHGNFELLPVSKDTVEAISSRKNFVGLIGLSGVTPRTALAVELDDRALSTLSKQFLGHIEAAIARVEESMRGADWNNN
jgi:hypothetical protein